MAATKTATFTEQQKAQALGNARKSLAARRNARTGRNTFSEWGNDKCISRLIDTIRDMENGQATVNQYRYWLNN